MNMYWSLLELKITMKEYFLSFKKYENIIYT